MNIEQFKHWCELYNQPSSFASRTSPLVMGVLNLTPDSFSDGGEYCKKDAAILRAHHMIAEGADLIDIGGESSRPGANPISLDEELSRVIPIIEQLRQESDICISIDTYKPEVMNAALCAGASIINDIKGLENEKSLKVALEHDVPVCLMHMQGDPKTMQQCPEYENDVVHDMNDFFHQKIAHCVAHGLKRSHLILDPGFGFGKSVQHNLQIIKRFAKFHVHNLPLMLGVSRKSSIGTILKSSVHNRLSGALAITVYSALQGLAMIRTHDVAETKQALVMVDAIHKVA